MSGICGMARFDGGTVDRERLAAMTAFMATQGPDAQGVWAQARVGLGHALLRTTVEARDVPQPASLDAKLWIAADARIDARSELARKIEAAGRAVPDAATDAELILLAYQAWGDACVTHLIGDFAFAIWDDPRQRLFCARDHFGVKPFFFAAAGRRIVFGNSLACVRRGPGVSAALDELAIADFLLFEMNQDPRGTAFADIRRLPPAHTLAFSADGLRTARYWALPDELQIEYRDAGEELERFRELLGIAVADRLRTDRAAVLMSGGIDSPAVAAVAATSLPRTAIRACTTVYDRLIPDRERLYAGMVADKLGIPIQYRVADDYRLYDRYDEMGAYFVEPDNDAHAAIFHDGARDASAHARVILTGWDGDAVLNDSPRRYFGALLRQRRFGRLLSCAARYVVTERKIPAIGLGRRADPRRHGDGSGIPPFPNWLNPAFAARLGLRERWAEVQGAPTRTHRLRPGAFHALGYISRRSNFFDGFHPGCTHLPLEFRHPLLDLRLVEFCLSLPPFPACHKKRLLRDAMRGVLPEAVLDRPKTSLAGFPYLALLREPDAKWIDASAFRPEISSYVDLARIPAACGQPDPDKAWASLRPRSLDLWLRALTPYDVKQEEVRHEYA